MSLHHIALWSRDIEALKDFYVDLFKAVPGERYEDERGFCSYFLSFDHGCQLEIMQIPGVLDRATPDHDEIHHVGLHHFAFTAQTDNAVRVLTQRARDRNCRIIKEPHATGDGYFEAMLTDPDGNLVEVARAPEAMTPPPSREHPASPHAEATR
ncbi:MAG: VOC family protein [Roseibium sp.]|uniref:VOC family protein n=1 Tax=Roseibium sp. TaxID=1936156 RepID=UPI001B18C16E|nr:VOC family protein [Roseibium sp.]MBO6509103.1 VOC family protein [Roseibium sp.]MBO6894923.1 VOC family protein [Roseibium sp.]MBO6930813.1 VOC family protein [Roseibium sp.]